MILGNQLSVVSSFVCRCVIAAALGVIFGGSSLAFAGAPVSFRFAVTDDSRAEGGWGARDNGVATVVVHAIARDIAAQRLDLVLFPGDMASGTNDPQREESMLKTWKQAMAPVYDAGIPVYVTRGNHEYRPSRHGAKNPDSPVGTFLQSFPMPLNGPAGEKGLTYSFGYKNARFIAFDQYAGRQPGFDNTRFAPGANRGEMMNRWVLDEIERSSSGVTFVMGHEMLTPSSHTDCLANDPESRDALLRALGSHNGTYFAGHDHLYLRGVFTDAEGRRVPAFVVGTGGAGNYDYKGDRSGATYPGAPRYQLQKVLANRDNPYFGYLLVTVYADNSWRAEFRGFRFNKWGDASDVSLTPISVLDAVTSAEMAGKPEPAAR